MNKLIEDDSGDLTTRFKEVLTEIFKRFDKDQDGVLCENELHDFAKACNGIPFEQDALEEIRTYFKVDDKGNLTQEGFLEMYHMQSQADPDETFKDLGKLGYDKKLNQINS